MEVLLFIAVFIILVKVLTQYQTDRRRNATEPVIAATIAEHTRTLYVQMEQLKKVDPYGNVNYDAFAKHLLYFIEKVISRDLTAAGLSTKDLKDPAYQKVLVNRIATAVVAEGEKAPGDDLSGVVSGIDYEVYCKTRLDRAGWEVRMTPASGDQGADLIATKLGKKLVVQCKYYGQPVGNKAVQEAYAAKTFQKADFAIVVTNSSYTPSAQQLAQTNGVVLTHHLSLSDLDQLLGLTAQPAHR